MYVLVALLVCSGVSWEHPAGLVNDATLREVRRKVDTYEWARATYDARKKALQRWVEIPREHLERVFPKKRGNVYHNFSCPTDRTRLQFDPFECTTFRCPRCGTMYSSDTDPGVYPPGDRYHGTMYDGWACLFFLTASSVAADVAIIGNVEKDAAWLERAKDLLHLFVETVSALPTDFSKDPQFNRILTYHREGDNKVLCDLAVAYELVRNLMTPQERSDVETALLNRMLEDVMLERIYTYDHNNVYQWHRTILQTALSLEREDLIAWVFGYGEFDPQKEPEHRSMRRILATHFKEDGAFWELCSGYHLYPMTHLCEFAVLSRNLSDMDPRRFPRRLYDLTDSGNAAGQVIGAALEWFMSMAMPDRTVPVVGDSTISRSGMADYSMTAEVGYRYFDVKEVGDYADLRSGRRSWVGLLYGADEIRQHRVPYTSSYLTSGWVSLRKEHESNRIWVGLNALEPGGSHQHADRLTLLLYSHDQLLALEKSTPYNESVTRVLGTLTPSHNTVTVDQTSQKQGESLTEKEIPCVAVFYGSPIFAYAELHGDAIYPQTKVYRRYTLLLEDVVVDLFRVEGGHQHDWMLHHSGAVERVSIPLEDSVFEPHEWLYNGTERVRKTVTNDTWTYEWKIDTVHSRLTMLGEPHTQVFLLETYPVDNAVITDKNPPCNTLCVRRTDDKPFLAIWDSWNESPNLKEWERGDGGDSLMVKTQSNVYYLLFGGDGAVFSDGTRVFSDGHIAVLRNRDAVFMAQGSYFRTENNEGNLEIQTAHPITLCAEKNKSSVVLHKADAIQYVTRNSKTLYSRPPDVRVHMKGSLWQGLRIRNKREKTSG